MIVPPGLSRPARSAASIIGRPIRSLTEPPGLSISSLASRSGWRSAGPRSRVSRVIRTSGVSPTRSRIDSAYCIAARIACRSDGPQRPPDRPASGSRGRGQASRSSRPGRSSSQVSRSRRRRGCAGGSTVAGGAPRPPARAGRPSASLIRRASVELLARSRRAGSAAPADSPASARTVVGRQDPRRHPPAEVELLGAGDRERHDRRVGPQGDDRPARAGTARSGRAAR